MADENIAESETFKSFRSLPRKVPPTAFLLFCQSAREEVKLQLQREEPLAKVTLGALQRVLSEKWKKLDATERKPFEDQSTNLKRQFNLDKLTVCPSPRSLQIGRYRIALDLFPTNRFQKLLRVDSSVKRISSEALDLMNRSTVLFLQYLVKQTDKSKDKQGAGKGFLSKDDIVTAIRRGGLKLKFLLACMYALDDESIGEGVHSLFRKTSDQTYRMSSGSAEVETVHSVELPTLRMKKLGSWERAAVLSLQPIGSTKEASHQTRKRKKFIKSANITSFFKKK
ncbi:HMG (high mobility group) box domain-containing protein [Cardiosporidium cionae]|uniref:HMG (High mobility group) box domain-containing protein n=1 Tax=Cardiosporidium cionae TaxID=476202 RepID=A0ABQ7JEU9_9APIC|nr:HMG (high mobility group) box domain-containing protein [Cardiosporidium cionae]|eukprot:KAF8822548.1 HMG (high mobility group) box domain-containing protein [Cardiosporidium cionae]